RRRGPVRPRAAGYIPAVYFRRDIPGGSLMTMCYYVLGNPTKPGVRQAADALVPRLNQCGEVIVYDLDRQADLSRTSADLAFVLGGDGAILRAARQMGYH